MKSMSTLALAAALALTGAGIVSAQTVYHVSGSTAYRVADVSAEVNFLIASHGGANAAYVGSSLTGANSSVIESGDSTIIFENLFNGSILGDESVSGVSVTGNGNKIAFPTTTGVTLAACSAATTTTAATGGTSVTGSFTNVTAPLFCDIAFSDVSFATASKIIKLATSTTPNANNAGTVGIVPFVFVANTSTDVTDFGTNTVTTTGSITSANATVAVNVTPQSFTDLYSNGVLGSITGTHATVFTGSTTDTGLSIFATGRDIDSGTRSTALAETGFGLGGSGANAVVNPVNQVYPQDSTGGVVGNTGNGPIDQFEQVPAASVDGIAFADGNSGYASGGNLAKALSTTMDSNFTKSVFIGYLGVSDAFTALTASGTNRQAAKLLGYNGSTFNPAGSTTASGFATTADLSKIYSGQYTYWGFEHVYYNTNNGANPSSVVSSLVSELNTDGIDVLSSAGVHAASMIVSRSDDGLQVQ
jgi:hypothetical protein